MQYTLILDTARAAYHAGDGRAAELARLRGSRSVLDRYAALLADQWAADDRVKR